jgi:hypothetical protein
MVILQKKPNIQSIPVELIKKYELIYDWLKYYWKMSENFFLIIGINVDDCLYFISLFSGVPVVSTDNIS